MISRQSEDCFIFIFILFFCATQRLDDLLTESEASRKLPICTIRHDERPSMCEKRPSMCQKRPSMCQKRPSMCQKRPSMCQKRPSMCQKRPIMCQKRPSMCLRAYE